MLRPASVVELLQDLVRIPSVNPDGNASTFATGEADCAAYVGEYLSALGADVAFEEVLPGRPNVIAEFPSRGSGKPKVLLGPHLDTVAVDHMTIDPFGADIREGRVYGRGTSDTKGTMAAMLWALRELGERVADLNVAVSFVAFMGEEAGQPGSIHFAANHPDYDFAIIGEPTQLDVVYTHKGCAWADIHTHGRAAHGSTPEAGRNAILTMAHWLVKADRELRSSLAAFSHETLGPSTLNVGICEGGRLANIVADHCRVVFDIRSTPALAEYGVNRLLEEFFGGDPEVTWKLKETFPLNSDPHHPMIQKLAAAGSGKLVGAPWYCDAAHLANVGIPSVAAGPGSIAQAHTEDEWLAIADLEKGVNFYRAFLESC